MSRSVKVNNIKNEHKHVLMLEFQDTRYATRALKEARTLVNAGYRITFISFNQALKHDRIQTEKMMTFYELANPSWGLRAKSLDAIKRYFSGLLLLMRMNLMPLFYRAHVYHVHDLKVLPGGVLGKLFHGGRLVYDSHELHMAKHAANTAKKRFLNKFNFYLEKSALPVIDVVIHASPLRAAYVKALYKMPEPLVLENHAPLQQVKRSDSLRAACNVKPTDFLLLFVGGIVLGTFKKVERVIEALPFLNDRFHFCLVGPCSDINRATVLDLARQLKVSQRVHVLEPVPSLELVSYISSADLNVIPIEATCLNEEYSALNKFSESCMAGVPVLASEIANLTELVYKNPVGPIGQTFNINDLKSLVAAIQKCASRTLLQRYRRNAVKLAKNFINWEKQESRLLCVYRDITQTERMIDEKLMKGENRF